MLYRILIIDRYSHLYSYSSTSTRTRTRSHVIIKYSDSDSDSHILQVLVLVLVLVNLVLAPALIIMPKYEIISGEENIHLISIVIMENTLAHWGRITHICVGKLTTTGWDNGLSPGRRQATIWTNAGILLIGPLGTNLSDKLIEIYTFPFKKMHL